MTISTTGRGVATLPSSTIGAAVPCHAGRHYTPRPPTLPAGSVPATMVKSPEMRPEQEPPMASPFPGMDPYLEAPDLWAGVHGALIATLREFLSPLVAPRFFVDTEDSVYILGPDDPGRR